MCSSDLGFVGIEGFTASAEDLVVEINRGVPGSGGASDVVIDHSVVPLDVRTGPDSSMVLDMDGSKGELTRASGKLDLNVFNFLSLSGDFAFEQSSSTVTLDTGDEVAVNLLTVGGSHIDAFVGMNGERDENGDLGADALGLDLSDASFGVALMSDKADATRSWTSVQASAGGLSFVGIEGLTVSGSDLSVLINRAAGDGSVVDYSDGKTDLSIATSGDSADDLKLSMAGSEGETLKASGHLDIDLFGFFQVSGDFAFEKSTGSVTLSNGEVIEKADLLTLGGNDIDAFAGLNGGTDDKLGLELGGASFGLALITDQAEPSHKFTSLQASADLAQFVGVDGLTVAASELQVNINQGITLPAVPEVVTKVNTQFNLELPVDAVGTLTLSKGEGSGADTAQVSLTGKQSNAQILEALTEAFESLDGVEIGRAHV